MESRDREAAVRRRWYVCRGQLPREGTSPSDVCLADLAILRVRLADAAGKETTAARPLRWFDGEIVENRTAVAFDGTSPTNKLAIIGSINKDVRKSGIPRLYKADAY